MQIAAHEPVRSRRRGPAGAEPGDQQPVDDGENLLDPGDRVERVPVAAVIPTQRRLDSPGIGVRRLAKSYVHVAGAVGQVNDVPVLGDEIGSTAEWHPGVGAIHERRDVLRGELLHVIVGDAVRVRSAELAGAPAARVVVPAGAAALKKRRTLGEPVRRTKNLYCDPLPQNVVGISAFSQAYEFPPSTRTLMMVSSNVSARRDDGTSARTATSSAGLNR